MICHHLVVITECTLNPHTPSYPSFPSARWVCHAVFYDSISCLHIKFAYAIWPENRNLGFWTLGHIDRGELSVVDDIPTSEPRKCHRNHLGRFKEVCTH